MLPDGRTVMLPLLSAQLATLALAQLATETLLDEVVQTVTQGL